MLNLHTADDESDLDRNAILTAAIDYLAEGWDVIPLGEKSKQPLGVGGNLPADLRREMGLQKQFNTWRWKDERVRNSEEARILFHPRNNIGVALGERSKGMVDLDFDMKAAALMGNIIFPDCPSFGRQSAPTGHRILKCPDAGNTTQITLTPVEAEQLGLAPKEKSVVLEIRCNGGYTMFPPSTHPSGEKVEWCLGRRPQGLPEMPWEELKRKAHLCAGLAIIAHKYPEVSGDRDNICLALSGVLLKAGMNPEQADAFVISIARLKGDEEADKRGKASATAKKIEKDEPVWGLTKLCDLLGIPKLLGKLQLCLYGEKSNNHSSLSEGTILQRDGFLSEIVSQAEAALIHAQVPIYQYGNSLVRTGRFDLSNMQSEESGVTRQTGSPILIRVNRSWLTEKMSETARWVKLTSAGKFTATDPNSKYAAHLLAREGEWNFPVLKGLISAPTLRQDGSILQKSGYDTSSKLLYEPAGVIFPEIPGEPSREQALAALETLENLFKQFPFIDDSAGSVPLAAILTGIIRKSIPTAPMFCFDAPTAGTGKSMIAETIGIIVTGHKPPSMSQGKSLEEDEKRFATVLIAGDQAILLDNCVRPIEGDFLCSMVTQEFVQARILGKSERVRLPSDVLIMATGNNLIIAGDMTRRTLLCRMDAKIERPEDRQFDFDPRQIALAQRPHLVVAALTILKAYIHAGRPCSLPKIGSFEDWNIVREAIVWLGRADPAETRQLLREDDPRKIELIELMTTWLEVFGEREATLNQVRDLCGYATGTLIGPQKARLYQILLNLSREKTLNHRAVGRFMTSNKDRVVAGMVLRKREKSNAAHWRVEFANEEARVAFSNANQGEEIPF